MILVTGATGFVGKALVKRLLYDGVNVLAGVRKSSQDLPKNINQLVLGDLSELKEDLFNEYNFFEGVNTVVHTAARVHIMSDDVADPLLEFRRVNRDATLLLAKMAAKAGVKRFVFLSSIGVNGSSSFAPFVEKNKPEPHNFYAISKYEAEKHLLKLAQKTDMEVVIIRPPLVYALNAPGNFKSLLKWMKKSIPLPFGAINNQRSLVALDNLVDFIVLCADKEKSPKAANEVFLISDGEDVSTTELLQKVAKSQNKKAWLIPVPVSLMVFFAKLLGKKDVANRLFGSLQVDSSKAYKLLGWKPVITMDEQLQKMDKGSNEENI